MQQDNQAFSAMKTLNLQADHQGMIHDAQYDYYGKRLATCSNDGKIHVFSIGKTENSKVIIQDNAENHAPIWKISWAHPCFGVMLASCSFNKIVTIYLEALHHNQQAQWVTLWKKAFDGSINYLQFSPWESGLNIACASSSGKVWLISQNQRQNNFSDFEWQAHNEGVNCLSWQPYQIQDDLNYDKLDRNRQVLPRIVTGSCDKTLAVWSIQIENDRLVTEKICDLKDAHKDWVRDVAWCPAVGNSYDLIASCSEDSKVVLWKLYSNEGQDRIEHVYLNTNFNGPAWRLSWSSTGNMLSVSGSTQNNDNQVVVFQENDKGEWEIINSIDQEEVEDGANN